MRTALAFLLISSLGAQQPSPARVEGSQPSDRPRFGTSTAAVTVDVIVRDRKGQPVVDLTPDAFEIFEDGKPQRLIAFDRVMPGRAATATATPTAAEGEAALPGLPGTGRPPLAGTLENDPSPRVGQSVVALVFDQLSFEARTSAWRAASQLLDGLQANDFAAVYTIDLALHQLAPFTRDTRMLKEAFDLVRTQPATNLARQDSTTVASVAARPDLPITAGAEELGQFNPQASPGPTPGPASDIARMLEATETRFQMMARNQRAQTLATSLEALVETVGVLPGRKTIVFFSEGLTIINNNRHRIERVIDLANSRNVSFYTLDAAGLQVHSIQSLNAQTMPQASVADENAAAGAANDPTERRVDALWRDPTQGLRPLAERTGGLYIGDTNDLNTGFARIDADRRFHYLLAYSSTNPALDGKFRRIEVKVRRKDVRVRARSGYVASPAIERVDRREYELPVLDLLERSPSPWAFPLQLRALSTPLPQRPGLLSILVEVGQDAVTFETSADGARYLGELTILSRVVGADGTVQTTQSERYRLTGEVGKLPAVRHNRLLYFRTPEVPAGSHMVHAAAYDVGGSRASVLRVAVMVPPADPRPIVGDLVIVSGTERVDQKDAAMKNHPLAADGILFYPGFGEPIRQHTKRELTFVLPLVLDPGSPLPQASMELFAGTRALTSMTLRLTKADKSGRLLQVGRLPLAALLPGSYELRARVSFGSETAVRTAAFTIVP
jgi:VWFA-related protein